MKKITITIFSFLCLFLVSGDIVSAQSGSSLRNNTSTPTQLLDSIVGKANESDRINDTTLDGVTSQDSTSSSSGNPQFRITNTLGWISAHLHPYLQRIVFLGLTIATILIIYNGFMMVTNTLHDQGEIKKIQKNFVYIGIGVVILVGFYYLLDFVVAVLNMLLG
ncbi:hypothetical protein AGMMS50249_7260 [candidate division SR1 bacterium]|nr:hypothetical protein AGMMS50249_7260 [candidate division SR1 bacterium]